MPKYYVMKLESPANPAEISPLDGKYLAAYDPERDGLSPNGLIMQAHVLATSNPAEALQFRSIPDLLEVWKRQCKRDPVRPDGYPNRYLTYWNISIEVYNTDAPY